MSAPRLTIGMATYDDFDGVYFTVTSLMIHHRDVMRDCDIVVVDNNPGARHGRLVREWIEQHVPQGKYIPFSGPSGTAPARNEVFRHGAGQHVLCVDCHVLIVPGAIQKLLDYYAANPNSRDLLTGPLLMDSGQVAATHQRPQWSKGAWGVWDLDPRGRHPRSKPFEIWQQGLGLFSCRRDAWVGFHPDYRGFGGCETYVMEKFRRRGSVVLCCPWLRWTHRFTRPRGAPYRVSRRDSLRNYLIGFKELGLPVEPVRKHFAELNQETRRARTAPPAEIEERSIAVFGERASGAVRMRGAVLADHLRCQLMSSRNAHGSSRWDAVFAVKECGPTVRQSGERLIYDPVDVFWKARPNTCPLAYWRRKYDELRFDDILATSPACAAIMRAALPPSVRIHLVPHQCDPRINESWGDRDGPVVYAGLPHFISLGMDRIRDACQLVGKEFVMDRSCEVIKGASLVLALRLPPYDTKLNRHCKPLIKIANAMAAGVPVVATDCPSALSLYPDLPNVPVDFTVRQLAGTMRRALENGRPSAPYRAHNYLSAVNRILGRPSLVVYTAIFGSYDVLRDPLERTPGVQYVCFTDNPRFKSNVWTFHYCRPSTNPLMQAKACKILAHEYLDCDASLWIDGRVQLRNLDGIFQNLSADVAMQRHVSRNCIYVEAAHCKAIRRGDPSLIDRAVARYKAEGHPPESGLWYCGIVLRRHTKAAEAFNREWWREVSTGTTRDQVSLPVVLRRLSTPFETLPDNVPQAFTGNHLR